MILRSDARGLIELEDVAEIRVGTAPDWTRVTAAGADAVLLNVYQQPDGNTVQIARDVAARVREYQRELPPDLHLAAWYDQSELIESSVAAVRDAILVGAVLAIAMLAAFLRSWRITLVVALFAPAVIATSMLLLRALGLTLNIMTLGGIAASVGLVIDDAIVVIEHAVRQLRAAPAQRRSVFAAAREMIVPLTGSSLVTTVIFVPLAFLTGVTGAFLRPLSLTVALTLAVSYVFALLVVPVLVHLLVRERDTAQDDYGPRFARFLAAYERLLKKLLAAPRRSLAAAAVALVLGAVALVRLPTGFLPQLDEGGFVLDYRAPAGTSLSRPTPAARGRAHPRRHPRGGDLFAPHGLALGGFSPRRTRATSSPPAPAAAALGRRGDRRGARAGRARGARFEIELPQLVEDLIGDLTGVPQPIEVKLFASEPARCPRWPRRSPRSSRRSRRGRHQDRRRARRRLGAHSRRPHARRSARARSGAGDPAGADCPRG